VNPDRIIDFLHEKKRRIEGQERDIMHILPQLKLKQEEQNLDSEAEIFKGWHGMTTVYNMLRRTMKQGEVNLVLGASKGEDEVMVRNFYNKHLKELATRKIRQRIIYNESARGNILEQYKHPQLFKVKYLENTTPAEINIWAEKTMIVILRKNPTVILINDAIVTNSFKQYFNVMWKIAVH